MKKLLAINRSSGIKQRASIKPSDAPAWNRAVPPSCTELDEVFRTAGVDLTVQACKKALKEWGGSPQQITHTVGVTCTNAGTPGYDFLVAEKLKIPVTAQRTLLSGVGCAGGLAALRQASSLACSATLRGLPARILVFACEVSSIFVRCDLACIADEPDDVRVGLALFSDGAASIVVCNELGMEGGKAGVYSVLDWSSEVLPNTMENMSFYTVPLGKSHFIVV
jgi:type III polyketide synthase